MEEENKKRFLLKGVASAHRGEIVFILGAAVLIALASTVFLDEMMELKTYILGR